MTSITSIRVASWLLVGAAMIALVQALWIPAKAQAAQLLLHRAWASTLQDGRTHKPWPWADHAPVARLKVLSHQIDQIVLAGDSGAVLAFGPGQNQGARTLPGSPRVIAGHRDTHFRFLKDLAVGEELLIQSPQALERYRVASKQIVDAQSAAIDGQALGQALVLVTCYPFDALQRGGNQRMVVFADPIKPV